MRIAKHRRNVEKAMRDAMKDDKAKHTTSRLSANGLLEINRQRLKKALQLRTHRPCPTCSGAGTIASPELVGWNILRRLETRAVTGRIKAVRVSLHPELADAIQHDRRKELADLEREFDIRVEIIAATGLHRSDERIEWVEKPKTPTVTPVSTAAVTAADLAEGVHGGAPEPEKSPAEADGRDQTEAKVDKPARKRRRGSRKRRKTSGSSDETPTESPSDTSQPAEAPETGDGPTDEEPPKDKPARKRRRGGRKRKKKAPQAEKSAESEKESAPPELENEDKKATGDTEDKPKKPRRRRPRRPKKPKADAESKPEPKKEPKPEPESKPKAESKPDKGPDPFAY